MTRLGKISIGLMELAFCSVALAQLPKPAPKAPAPATTLPSITSLGGTWRCGTGAQVSLTIAGGSFGSSGTVLVQSAGTHLGTTSYAVSPGQTQSVTVTTSYTDCNRPVVFEVDVKGTHLVAAKWVGPSSITLSEATGPI